MSLSGTVEKWMPYKGYGFIRGEDGDQVFVFNGSLVGGTKLVVGQRVNYDVGVAQAKGSTKAQKEGARPAVNVSGPAVQGNTKGALTGRVKEWLAPRSCGFIITPDQKVYYVHHSAFDGAKLQNDEEVYFDQLEGRVHKTGRGVAVNVTGPGVKPRATCKGTVRRWSFENRYGFVTDEVSKVDIFVHAHEIGGAALTVGKDLWYDVGTRDGKKYAYNISGPAVTDVKTYLNNNQGSQEQNGGHVAHSAPPQYPQPSYGNSHGNGNGNSRSNGHTNGHSNGHSSGYTNGHSNGYTNGYSNGYSNGHSNGYSNEHSNGHSSGMYKGSKGSKGGGKPSGGKGMHHHAPPPPSQQGGGYGKGMHSAPPQYGKGGQGYSYPGSYPPTYSGGKGGKGYPPMGGYYGM